MERPKPTENRFGLSLTELKVATGLTDRLVSEFKPAIDLVSDPEIMKETGWRASWRRKAKDSKWQWTILGIGNLAVEQERVLRGPKGEKIDVSSRYDPTSDEKNPDLFQLGFTNSNGNRFSIDINFKDYSIPSLDMFIEDKNSTFFYELNNRGRKIIVRPRDIRGIALFFKGLDFAANDSGLIDLSTRENLYVGEHGATPNTHKISSVGPIGIVKWYTDQKYEGEKVSDVTRWIEGIPAEINLFDQMTLLELEEKQTLQTMLSIAKNPTLGSVWTRERDNEAFTRTLDSLQLKRRT